MPRRVKLYRAPGSKAVSCSLKGPLFRCDVYCWDFENCLAQRRAQRGSEELARKKARRAVMREGVKRLVRENQEVFDRLAEGPIS